mgnify:CR=1 FL=1
MRKFGVNDCNIRRDFKIGDRIIKQSGLFAGKNGTVKNIREDGTLNVAFDGVPLAKWCDPMKCVPVAVNVYKTRLKGFKIGDKVKDRLGEVGVVEEIQSDDEGPFGPPPSKYGDLLGIRDDKGRLGFLNEFWATRV